ncbi:hypothetical protein U3516DRAFT_767789 [Neocallimastix sp. 'constans']
MKFDEGNDNEHRHTKKYNFNTKLKELKIKLCEELEKTFIDEHKINVSNLSNQSGQKIYSKIEEACNNIQIYLNEYMNNLNENKEKMRTIDPSSSEIEDLEENGRSTDNPSLLIDKDLNNNSILNLYNKNYTPMEI